MTKNELYEALKNDGAKLKLINFYTQEQLQSIYDDRFGAFNENLDSAIEQNDEDHEEPNTEKLNDDEQFTLPTEPTPCENPNDEETIVEIKTLMFDHGGWCNELGVSYAPGIYRPATIEEFVILKEYAKEIL